MILQVQHISKKYKGQAVVDNVSFSAGRGEIIGFLGLNGAGKSTTLKMIAGCLSIDQGDVFIGNHSIVGDPLKAKALIGYLPEHNALYEEMYVREYLEHVAGLYHIPGKRKDLVDEMIKNIGLSPESHKKIGQLSKGYRQRAGLAQAFIHRPELLILDEPLTGLDPN
ncbi:MAG: ABC transporter ATP-binding protein, partial [Dysgonamonadaceae bacterium]|nr:ABC transporter ATP-binding protein [Dysgonamonadaceae bacterium]